MAQLISQSLQAFGQEGFILNVQASPSNSNSVFAKTIYVDVQGVFMISTPPKRCLLWQIPLARSCISTQTDNLVQVEPINTHCLSNCSRIVCKNEMFFGGRGGGQGWVTTWASILIQGWSSLPYKPMKNTSVYNCCFCGISRSSSWNALAHGLS